MRNGKRCCKKLSQKPFNSTFCTFSDHTNSNFPCVAISAKSSMTLTVELNGVSQLLLIFCGKKTSPKLVRLKISPKKSNVFLLLSLWYFQKVWENEVVSYAMPRIKQSTKAKVSFSPFVFDCFSFFLCFFLTSTSWKALFLFKDYKFE